MSGVSARSVLGPALFNNFVGVMNSGTEYILRKFVDCKQCGAVNTLEGRNANQRNLVRLKK